MNINEVKDKIYEIEPSVILLSTEYKNNKSKLILQCKCGQKFEKTWTTIQTHKSCLCRSCARKQGWEKFRRPIDFEKQAEKVFNEKGYIPLHKIDSVKTKILCVNKQGYKGYINYENVIKNKKFSVFSTVFNQDNLLFNLQHFTKLHKCGVQVENVKVLNPSYTSIVFCKCKCGKSFTSTLGDFTTQHHWLCPSCAKSQSRLELLAEIELQKHTKNYIKQKRFKDCRNNYTNAMLIFDFFLPDINTCIEVDGKQHFKPSKFNNISDEESIQMFHDTQDRDKQKDDYCFKHGIKLIRISYLNFPKHSKKYKSIISNLFVWA